jgi:fimbrial isopeptide formation D2 family protein/LPXTG-motif cell wall-anchored protein
MKKMKKILAMALAMAMVLGMSVTTFAADKVPDENDAKAVTISNVEEGATYRAYQIIDAAYGLDGKNFIHYVWAPGTDQAGKKVVFSETGESAVVEGLTDDLITQLAADPTGLTEKADYTPDTPLEVGTWMILVTPPAADTTKIYNPMIASVFYSVNGSGNMNDVESGTIDADRDWELVETGAFAKSSTITLDKELDNRNTDTEVSVGDTVSFTITTNIPSYDANYYEDPTFVIKDEIVNGLAYVKADPGDATPTAPVVTVGGKTVTAGDNTYKVTWTPQDGKPSFQITFAPAYLTGLASAEVNERAVTVKYSATVTDDAVKQVGENKASLDYSRTPTETDTKEDKEYVFTFALHGELFKVDDADAKLPDAVFTLYEEDTDGDDEIVWAENDTKQVSAVGDPYTTTADGEIRFKGLDGDKTYYLKETAAPTGYTINDTVYKIEFVFDKPDDYKGEEITYTVKVTSNETPNPANESYTVKYGNKVDDEYGNGIATGNAINIQNTKLSSLPSTGGIGTTIFTIGGCAVMIIAAGLYFANRRKTAK